ncbi:hypothetical protein [Modestobacter marinus]|uniref:hypothetical protein n=1 Tax=Modestobacter marinus TaxID=477641 RepID=UPI001C946F22|nr:hypothetical protein [Modestobacter marinus]
MQVETGEPEIIERVAGLDIGKARWCAARRCPTPRGQRMQEVRTVPTMTATLLGLGDWLAGLGVGRIEMEATSDHCRAPFYLFEDRFETWLVNATTSSTCPAGRRPTGWTRCGCARSPSARCCAPASCRRRRSDSCGI